MSKPPARKPKIEFPDPNVHAQKRNLYKEIRDTIIQLRKLTPALGDKEIMIQFSNVIHPGRYFDASRLPYSPRNGRAKKARKPDCLFVKVCALIYRYWHYVLEDNYPQDRVEKKLKELQDILEKGLGAYRVEGDEAVGYYLALKN